MTLYLDTSALVKLYVEEEGSGRVHRALDISDLVATSALALLEARSAFVRRRYEGGLSAAEYGKAVTNLGVDWPRFLLIEVGESLIRLGTKLVETHRLRAYDALHLASAITFQDRLRAPLVFATWDRNLQRVAKREGLAALSQRVP